MFETNNNGLMNAMNGAEDTEEQFQEISENYQRIMPVEQELCFNKIKGNGINIEYENEGKRGRWEFQRFLLN